MKKLFTKFIGLSILSVLMVQAEVKAQTPGAMLAAVSNKKLKNKADSAAKDSADVAATATASKKTEKKDDAATFVPLRRLWGYAFGDAYYVQHAPPLNSTLGKENNYYQTPTDRNAFQFRRLYLGYDYDINEKFRATVLLASEPNENTIPSSATSSVVNGDNLADGRMSFYIKNFNLRVREVWNGTDFVIGEMSTPGFALNESGTNAPNSLSEATWGYRSIERTITDFHKNNSYDVGAALQGTFDPKTKNYGYVFMIGDNTQSNLTTVYNPNSAVGTANPQPNTGFFKIFYGDLWGKFLDKHLYVDFYADYARTASSIANATVTEGSVGTQEHSMYKAFVAYTTPVATVGVEGYIQTLDNAVINTTTHTAEKGTVNALSAWIRGAIVKDKWGYFARFDTYNPDTKLNAADTYTVNGNGYSTYDPTVKEQFYTFGLDYTPTKNVHFMPNVWLTRYTNNLNSGVTGYQPDDHTLVYRMTFFYTFGK